MLTFLTPTELDPIVITTMGLSAKLNENPVGQFGTGLKYALAKILSLGGQPTIKVCDPNGEMITYRFILKPLKVRGKAFQGICMLAYVDDKPAGIENLGFTTALGAHWEPWMAYRELRANTKDEGGVIYHSPVEDLPYPASGPWTSIEISSCPALEGAHEDGAEWFLTTQPIWANHLVEIHPQREPAAIFYRGIRVRELTTPALYTYNILSPCALTEDRTLDTWTASLAISQGVALLDRKDIADAILLAHWRTLEADFNFSSAPTFSTLMRELIHLFARNKSLNSRAKSRAQELFPEDYAVQPLVTTPEQGALIDDLKYLFHEFALTLPWKTIHPATLGPDDKHYVLDDTTLWLSPETLASPHFVAIILEAYIQTLPWSPFYAETLMVNLMRRAEPDLNIWYSVKEPLALEKDEV